MVFLFWQKYSCRWNPTSKSIPVVFVRRVNFACGTSTALLAKSIPLHLKLLVLKDLSEQLSRK